mmetsp:Transcript_112697/g.240565  ORF Transcript_112697/g.240565 Transcript_112697/m.240565 type:complete len:321 (-) Transcript_112697:30-992(-)
MGIFELQGIVKSLPVVFFGFIASTIQMLELRSYAGIWCGVFIVNCSLLLVAACYFSETRPASGAASAPSGGARAALCRELGEYRDLIVGRGIEGNCATGRVICLVLAYVLFDAISKARFSTLIFSFSMSYYSMTAAQVIICALPIILIHATCTPAVGKVCSGLGMRRGFIAVCVYKTIAASLMFLQPFQRWAWFAQYYLSSAASGWDALFSSLISALFKERTSKYMAMSTLVNYGANIISAPMYAVAFDATATSYFARLQPGLAGLVCYAIGTVILFHPTTGVWRFFCGGLDVMQKEHDEKRRKEVAEDGAAIASAKKTD